MQDDRAEVDVAGEVAIEEEDSRNREKVLEEVVGLLLKHLEKHDRCMPYFTNAWWNYLWCHHQFVTQFPSEIAMKTLKIDETLLKKRTEGKKLMIVLGSEMTGL